MREKCALSIRAISMFSVDLWKAGVLTPDTPLNSGAKVGSKKSGVQRCEDEVEVRFGWKSVSTV
jgi:hypothetical protein